MQVPPPNASWLNPTNQGDSWGGDQTQSWGTEDSSWGSPPGLMSPPGLQAAEEPALMDSPAQSGQSSMMAASLALQKSRQAKAKMSPVLEAVIAKASIAPQIMAPPTGMPGAFGPLQPGIVNGGALVPQAPGALLPEGGDGFSEFRKGDDWNKKDSNYDWQKKDDWNSGGGKGGDKGKGGRVRGGTNADLNEQMTAIIKGLPYDVEDSDLRTDMDALGKVKRFAFLQAKGIAFIMFEEEEALDKALGWDGTEYKGRFVGVRRASDPDKGGGERKNRGGGKGAGKVERNEELTVVVRGLDFEVEENDVRKDFEEYGEVDRFSMPRDKNDGKPKGIAFIQYKTEEACQKALEKNDTEYKGRTIICRKASDPTRGDGDGKGKGKREVAERNDELTVVARNLPLDVDFRKLRADFESCGEIARLNVPKDDWGKPKGLAFIQYKDEAGFIKSLEYNDTWYKGNTIVVVKVNEEREAKGKGKRKRQEKLPEGPTVYVTQLSFDTTEEDLKEYFSMCGEVVATRILRGGKGKGKGKEGKSRGAGMVVFKTEEEQQKAIADMHDTELQGRTIGVRIYTAKEEVKLDFSALEGEGDMAQLAKMVEEEEKLEKEDEDDGGAFDGVREVAKEDWDDDDDDSSRSEDEWRGYGDEEEEAPKDDAPKKAQEGEVDGTPNGTPASSKDAPDAPMAQSGSDVPAMVPPADAALAGSEVAPTMAPPTMAPPGETSALPPAAEGAAPEKTEESGRPRSKSRKRSRSRSRSRSPSAKKAKPEHEKVTGEIERGSQIKIVDPEGKEIETVEAKQNFADYAFHEHLFGEIEKAGFTKCADIQMHSWTYALKGNDVIGVASTGSGKTVAFLFPVFEAILRGEVKAGSPFALVLAPTRELACQTENEANKFGMTGGIVTCCTYGGSPKHEQVRQMKKGIHVLIATPGRLNDFLENDRETLTLKNLKTLVVDEADRMLDMGFEPQIRKAIKECPAERQTLFFTATWPEQVQKLATDFLNKPYQVRVGNTDMLSANESITQIVKIVTEDAKVKELIKLFLQYGTSEKGKGENRAMIFCNT